VPSRGNRARGSVSSTIDDSDSDNDNDAIDDVSVYHNSKPPAQLDNTTTTTATVAKKATVTRGGLRKGGIASRDLPSQASPIDYSKVHLQQDKCSGVYTEFADSGGVLLDVHHPLGATLASTAFIFDDTATSLGRHDLRASIYALLSRVGFALLPYATHQQLMTLRMVIHICPYCLPFVSWLHM
jgi:hypothetical protein